MQGLRRFLSPFDCAFAGDCRHFGEPFVNSVCINRIAHPHKLEAVFHDLGFVCDQALLGGCDFLKVLHLLCDLDNVLPDTICFLAFAKNAVCDLSPENQIFDISSADNHMLLIYIKNKIYNTSFYSLK